MNFMINPMNARSSANDNSQYICHEFSPIINTFLRNQLGGTRPNTPEDELDELYYHPNTMPTNRNEDQELIRYAERQIAMAQILTMSFDDFMMCMVNGFNEPRFTRATPGDADYPILTEEYQGDTKIMTAYLNREKLRIMKPAEFYSKYIHF